MSDKRSPAWDATQLLRASRSASLATQHGGQPYAALVTHAIAPDGAALILLSGLSEHTSHLRADPRCALLVVGAPADSNPQTAPRLTVLAHAAPNTDPALKARWLAIHPYAAFYADLPDFVLWRLEPIRGQFVAGFASAHRLTADHLTPDPAASAALLAAEPDIIAHCNVDHPAALDAIAQAHSASRRRRWRMVALDVAGCDLADDEAVCRIPWSAPLAHPMQVRSELVRLAHAARRSPPMRLDPAEPLP